MPKSLKAISKPDAESYAPIKKVQDIIPIKCLWANGTTQVGNERYSRVWSFDDINYQVSSLEEREDAQINWQDLLNSLEVGTAAKIHVMKSNMNQERFAKEILMPYMGDKNDKYRKEMNDLFLDATNGGKGYRLNRYITISCARKTYEEANSALNRIGASLTTHLDSMGCNGHQLNAEERCKLLHDFYRKGEESIFEFNFKEMKKRGRDFKDYICPDYVEQSKDYIKLGDGQYARVFWMKDVASHMKDDFLYELMELDRKLVVTIDVIPISNEDAYREVDRKMMGVESNIAKWQQKQIQNNNITSTIPYQMQKEQDEVRGFMDQLSSQDQRMFMTSIFVILVSEDERQLALDTEALSSRARERGCQLGILKYQQMDALKSALPIGIRKLDVMRTMTTHEIAIFAPFRVQELQYPGGVYYGINAVSGNLIMLDRSVLKNQSAVILGVPGSGKSFLMKQTLTSLILMYPDDEFVICDPEGEYGRFVQPFGGECFRIAAGTDNYINIMEFEAAEDEKESVMVSDKVELVLSVLQRLEKSGGGGVNWAKAVSIVDRCVWNVYNNYKRTGYMPTLIDMREELAAQPEQDAHDLALYLERLTSGSQDIFSRQTNVNTNNRILVYDISNLGEQMKDVGLPIIEEEMANRVTRNWKAGKRTHVIVDEFQTMFEDEHSAKFFDSAWRRFRKRGGWPIALSQNITTLLEVPTSRSLLSNSELVIMLAQGDADRERLAELFQITDDQLQYVRNVPAGHGLMRWNNILVPFKNDFPENTELYKIMTTKMGEGIMYEN